MEHNVAVGLSAILVIGIAAQWIGWRLAIPSILILLLAGLVAGPVTGFIEPDELFGDLLLPIVSLSVAIILFEGGLSLKIDELRQSGRAVVNLVTGGVVITWVLASVAAYYIFDIELQLAILTGAILTVTGPTVIGPLLRHIRPSGKGATTLKWEGILNDPIGALLAVLVFEAIATGELGGSFGTIALEFMKSIGIGVLLGGLGAGLAVVLLHRYWAPEFLHEVISLSIVIGVFTLSNELAHESGLLAVTLMGVIMANQRYTSVKHIVEFKENLRVVLVSALFIILAARIELSQLEDIAWQATAFVAALIFVVRPAAVFLSTTGAGLTWKDRLFVSWMAPRGIVAAAITAVFALGLVNAGYEEAESLVPIMFAVIVGTVVFYGLTAGRVARALGLAVHRHEGVVIVGAHSWAREMALELKASGFRAVLIDTDMAHVAAARASELEAHFASAVSDSTLDEIELQGLGRLIALTANDDTNSLACLHFAEAFGRSEVYQLSLSPSAIDTDDHAPVSELRGRRLFDSKMTYAELERQFEAGATIVTSEFTDEFTYLRFQTRHSGRAIPLFMLRGNEEMEVFTVRNFREPNKGDKMLWLHLPEPALDRSSFERMPGDVSPEKP